MLARGAQPQMPLVEQEGDAVLLRRDGVAFRCVDDSHVLHADLVADRRPRVGTDGADDRERALLSQVRRALEHLGWNVALGHHALDGSRPVADLEKLQLAARPEGIEPSVDRHALAVVRGESVDVDRDRRCAHG